MQKIWLNTYPNDVPAEINAAAHASLYAFFTKVCQQFPQHIAYEHHGVSLSYRQLQKKVDRFATYLHRKGITKGDRVALMLPNILHYPIAMNACQKLGAVVVNINPLYTAPELAHVLKDAQPKAIFIFDHFLETLQQTKLADELLVIKAGYADFMPRFKRSLINFVLKYIKRDKQNTSFKKEAQFMSVLKSRGKKVAAADISLTDLAFLQYTGGTTGVPKAAMLSHGNLLANVEQVGAWFAPVVEEGKEVLITALPLYHIFSLIVNGLLFLKFGAKNILVTNPRDINGLISLMKDSGFTGMIGVNALFYALVNNSQFNNIDFSRCHLAVAGGAALTQQVADKWKAITKTPLLEGYGLTEASPVVCVDPLRDYDFAGSIGLPMPSTDIKLINDQGEEVGFDEPGELCVKGPQVMQGYWHKPEETAKVITSDGWLKTGDMASIDKKGFVRLIDRKKEMIIVSGFNVYPSEIEEVIIELPDVAEVAVVGIEHKVQGERVAAFIVKKDDSLSVEQVKEHCQQSLTHYKIPKKIYFIDTLPKTPIGKVSRKALKEQFGGHA